MFNLDRLNLRIATIIVVCLVATMGFASCETEDDSNNNDLVGKPTAVLNLTATAGNGQVSLS